MSDLRLAIFDVDGTLVDSQGHIVAAMQTAYDGLGWVAPSRDAVLSIVGLSLEEAFLRLAPEATDSERATLSDGYKTAFADLRRAGMTSPLYPGVPEMLTRLHAEPELLLAIATGKSRRGLEAMLDAHDLRRFFVSTQVADDHPSKPHPSMVMTALAETGVVARNALMIGDTSFDMEMGAAAGVATIGVTWGYHPHEALSRATRVVDSIEALEAAIPAVLEERV